MGEGQFGMYYTEYQMGNGQALHDTDAGIRV